MCYNITAWYGNTWLPTRKYLYFTKREAIRQFRDYYNVKGKRLVIHVEKSAWL